MNLENMKLYKTVAYNKTPFVYIPKILEGGQNSQSHCTQAIDKEYTQEQELKPSFFEVRIGVIAKQLQLSHFVDDRDDCLQSVFSDACGNAGAAIERHEGQLFHFGRRGRNPRWSSTLANRRPSCVMPVPNWRVLRRHLNV